MARHLIHVRCISHPKKIELGIDINAINTMMMSSQGGRRIHLKIKGPVEKFE